MNTENGTDVVEFTTYEILTGRIINYGFIPNSMFPLQASDGIGVAQGKGHWDYNYVVNGEIIDRPKNNITINGMQITNIPNPSKMYINGTPYDLDDDSVEIDLTHPGTYKVKIICFPYLDAIFTMVKS